MFVLRNLQWKVGELSSNNLSTFLSKEPRSLQNQYHRHTQSPSDTGPGGSHYTGLISPVLLEQE